MTTLFFTASDGYVLQADLYRPEGPLRGAVLLAPAMGVRRRFYGRCAAALGEEGLAVLVPDYRGIGGSAPGKLEGFRADLVDWAEKDLPAALETLRQQVPGVPLFWIGHSVGGQLFGLAAGFSAGPDGGRSDGNDVRAALLVASQSGHWRHWGPVGRVVMWLVWHFFIPAATTIRGYLPMAALGQGEDVPAGVARQWAEWGRDRRYIGRYLEEHHGLQVFPFPGPVLSWAISDDSYAPPRSVEALLALFPRGELRVVRPEEAGVKALGHFGLFKREEARALWREAAAWLLSTVSAGDVAGVPTGVGPEA